jgi:hypothetical protein
MNQRSLTLEFSAIPGSELIATQFTSPRLEGPLRSVRGKWSGAYARCGTFEWSKAVQGLCVLLLRSMQRFDRPGAFAADLVGGEGSFAASLDYALSKQPRWMVEMFGTDSVGNVLLRYAIDRTNSNRKRPGPVALSLNTRVIGAQEIVVLVDGQRAQSYHDLQRIMDGISEVEEVRRAA